MSPVSLTLSAPAGSPHKILTSFLVQKLLDAFVLCSLAEWRHPRHKVVLLSPGDVTVQSHDPVQDLVHRVVLPLREREEGRRWWWCCRWFSFCQINFSLKAPPSWCFVWWWYGGDDVIRISWHCGGELWESRHLDWHQCGSLTLSRYNGNCSRGHCGSGSPLE